MIEGIITGRSEKHTGKDIDEEFEKRPFFKKMKKRNEKRRKDTILIKIKTLRKQTSVSSVSKSRRSLPSFYRRFAGVISRVRRIPCLGTTKIGWPPELVPGPPQRFRRFLNFLFCADDLSLDYRLTNEILQAAYAVFGPPGVRKFEDESGMS